MRTAHSLTLALAGLLAAATAAPAAVIPFGQNFDGLATGNTAVPDFTESNTAAMTIEPDDVGNDYQAAISGTGTTGTAVNVSAGVQLTNALNTTFRISTEMTVDAVNGVSTSTLNSGLGLFSDSANFSTGNQYRLLFTSYGGGANTGRLTLTETTQADLTGTLTSTGTLTGFVGKVLTLTADITQSGTTVTINASLTDGTTTLTVTGTDTSARQGQFFGYRTALNAVNGTVDINVDYDNFSTGPVPEPGSLAAIGIAGVLFARRRRRA